MSSEGEPFPGEPCLEGRAAVNLIMAAPALLELAKGIVKTCPNCVGAGGELTWDMNGGPPLQKCSRCTPVRDAIKLAEGRS
jgi:hypothetical protein